MFWINVWNEQATLIATSENTIAVSEDDKIEFQRYVDGYSKYVYGVAAGGVGVAQSTVFETGAGWVGVTTYRDNTGVERVKKEILVAMSGITTGTDSELYPPHVGE